MPLLVLLLVALAAGSLVTFVAWHYPHPGIATPTPAVAAARAVGREIGHHSTVQRTIKSRLNPEVATGLALTIALGLVLLGGLVLGAFAYLVRTNSQLVDIDASVAQWGADHAGPVSERWLGWITHLGDTEVVIVLAILLAVVEYIRRPSRWIAPFLLVVIVGQNALTNGIKELLDRVRPDLNPIAETLGPSFPAAIRRRPRRSTRPPRFYSDAADPRELAPSRGERRRDRRRGRVHPRAARLPLAQRRHRRPRLGWAWFAVCSIAFGGRMLRFGVAAEEAVQEADAETRRTATERTA